MAIYSIFGSAPPAGVATANDDTGAINTATAFYPFGGVTGWQASGARVWIPTDSNTPTTGLKAYLWTGSSWAAATQVRAVDFPTITKGAWNEVDFATPYPLTSGSYYWISVFYPGGCYPYITGAFGNSLQSNNTPNLYGAAFAEVTPGNGAYAYGSAGLSGGNTTSGHTWYGADILVWDGAGGSSSGGGNSDAVENVGITDAVTATRSGLASTAKFTGQATDPLGGTGSAVLNVPVAGTGTTIHTIKHTMYETSMIFGSAVTQGVTGPTPTSDIQPYELGQTFRLDRPCRVTGVKIWKHPDAAGTIPVTLWSKEGATLASTTVTWVADAGGWRTITFSSPVSVAGANTEYRISYFAANNKYGYTSWVFNAQDFVEPPFWVVAYGDGTVGGSCLNDSGTHAFPNKYNHASFWIHPMVEYDSDLPADAPGFLNQWTNYTPSASFPIGVFYCDPPWIADYASIGVTTLVGIPVGVPGYRDAIISAGVDVWATGGATGDGAQYVLTDPQLAQYIKGYFLHDEPDLNGTYVKPQVIRDQIAAIRRIDSTRPNMLNFGFGVGMSSGWSFLAPGTDIKAASLEWIEDANMADVISLDWYNLLPASMQGNMGPWTYPRFIKRLQKYGNGNRPVWGYVETTSQVPNNPQPAQVEAAVWGQIIAGAQGIVFFDHRFAGAGVTQDFAAMLHDAPMKAKVQAICSTIHSIGDALLAGEKGYVSSVSSSNTTAGPMGGTFGVPIETRSVSDASYRYVLAQASRPGTTTGTFTVPVAANKTLTVVGESRTVAVNASGVFTDTFDYDYAFHLYRWVP